MTYSYLRINSKISRPIIQIIVKSKTKFAIYPVLIDSGADYCIFHTQLAEDLGIKLQNKTASFKGVGKNKVVGFWGEVDLKIGEVSYQTKIIFAEISDFGHGILGQQGFFNHFDVKLSHHKQIIEIDPVKSRYYSV